MPAVPADLSDAEFAELGDLLAAVPEPLQPLDAVMLDGFLCGVIVQPRLVADDEWLAYVFDAGGHRWGEATPGAEQLRAGELVRRRQSALNRALAENGGFDPYLYEPQDGEPAGAALAPWAAGFMAALDVLPDLEALVDERVATELARIEHWLAEPPPAGTLERGIDALVGAVVALYDLTEPQRYRVEPVRREQPKVGRNAPCPCGSGAKYKHCHGAAAGSG